MLTLLTYSAGHCEKEEIDTGHHKGSLDPQLNFRKV